MIDPYIIRFIDEVVLPRANPLPDVPVELRDGQYESDGWYSWIAKPSSISESELDEISGGFGFSFPKLFKDYFLYKEILDGDMGIVRLPKIIANDPLSELRKEVALYHEFEIFSRVSLVPFAEGANDGGPFCFKIDEPNEEGDFPIYFIDHECLNRAGYCGVKQWDSFRSLLQAAESDILSYDAK